MVDSKTEKIIEESMETGWITEPDAKLIFSRAGLEVPRYTMAKSAEEAVKFAEETGFPVVAKVVSPEVVHKTEVSGVEVGITEPDGVREAFTRFSGIDGFTGMLVEEMLKGTELIVGAKKDSQFGPVILLGMGGIGVEIYQDSAIRMAPLKKSDIRSMVSELKARQLIEGFRGSEPVNMEKLTSLVIRFSELAIQLEDYFESIDLNPVICTGESCVIADARIILK
ncbi:MAG: acetyl-CoA synthetase [Candidatus Latescibacteria bacterium]|nr:acetyl-CoA synthetase [bacterium]MBD3425184.1 acetyl-CoA synthetase [Candidatus Latescibacterota bacterium]